MSTKAVSQGVASVGRRGSLDDEMSYGERGANCSWKGPSCASPDPDGTTTQLMSEAAASLSCILVALSFAVGGYIALNGGHGVETLHRPSMETRPRLSIGNNITASTDQNRTVPEAATVDKAAQEIKLAVGLVFRDFTIAGERCQVCPEMVVVPSGSFILGAGAGEPWREEWQAELELPTVKVTVTEPFAVGRFAVSFDEWGACVAERGCASTPDDNGWGRTNRPVMNISWHEASQYVKWLTRKTGKSYRLLSEAEREYVTRAGTTTAFWFGDAPSPKLANYLWDRTMPVNTLKANAWGLFHVHGNVSGWTADCWNSNHRGHSGLSAARISGDCKRRVVKGGAWFNGPNLLRSASRVGLDAASRYKTVGLRVARAVGEEN